MCRIYSKTCKQLEPTVKLILWTGTGAPIDFSCTLHHPTINYYVSGGNYKL